MIVVHLVVFQELLELLVVLLVLLLFLLMPFQGRRIRLVSGRADHFIFDKGQG